MLKLKTQQCPLLLPHFRCCSRDPQHHSPPPPLLSNRTTFQKSAIKVEHTTSICCTPVAGVRSIDMILWGRIVRVGRAEQSSAEKQLLARAGGVAKTQTKTLEMGDSFQVISVCRCQRQLCCLSPLATYYVVLRVACRSLCANFVRCRRHGVLFNVMLANLNSAQPGSVCFVATWRVLDMGVLANIKRNTYAGLPTHTRSSPLEELVCRCLCVLVVIQPELCPWSMLC